MVLPQVPVVVFQGQQAAFLLFDDMGPDLGPRPERLSRRGNIAGVAAVQHQRLVEIQDPAQEDRTERDRLVFIDGFLDHRPEDIEYASVPAMGAAAHADVGDAAGQIVDPRRKGPLDGSLLPLVFVDEDQAGIDGHGRAAGVAVGLPTLFDAVGQGDIIAGGDDDQFAPGQFHQAVNMAADAEIERIAVEANLMRAAIFPGHLPHQVKGPVGRGVVGKDDFQRRIGLGHRRLDGAADIVFLVVCEQHEGNQGPVHGQIPSL